MHTIPPGNTSTASAPLTPLTPLTQRFISHFGEMGSRWGINRTVGQIYALLYVLGQPLNADQIAEYLTFSRSNVSMGLKELQSWRLVKLLHHPGDRREYFEPPKDIWDIFKTLLEERRRREIEPTLSMLRDALLEALAADPLLQIDYVAVVDPGTLEPIENIDNGALIALAAWFGKTRLIDNLVIEPVAQRINPDRSQMPARELSHA